MRSLRAVLVPALVTGVLWSAPSERGLAPRAAPGGPSASTAIPVADVLSLQALPAGVTEAMVRQGKELFGGSALCSTCHGASGKGLPQLGSDLTDGHWEYSDGSYKGILSTIEKGVSAERSSTGIPMPPKAGANLTPSQVEAVAAYTWTLSHKGG